MPHLMLAVMWMLVLYVPSSEDPNYAVPALRDT